MEAKPTFATVSGRVAANVRGILATRQIRRSDFIAAMNWSKATASRRLNGGTWDINEVDAAADYFGVDITHLTAERAA